MCFSLFDDLQILLHPGDEALGKIALREFQQPLPAEAFGAEFFGDIEELEEAVFPERGRDEGIVGSVAVRPDEAGVLVPEGAAVRRRRGFGRGCRGGSHGDKMNPGRRMTKPFPR